MDAYESHQTRTQWRCEKVCSKYLAQSEADTDITECRFGPQLRFISDGEKAKQSKQEGVKR